MTRQPIVAGQFYPIDKLLLRGAVESSFTESHGPGKKPAKRGKGKVYGAISPHAGYMFSGGGAAWVFKEIGEAEFPDTYIILGVNHSGPETCSTDDDWETPMGVVKCDAELVEKLEEKGIPIDISAHRHEHSIEVQLPFLQYVSKDNKEKLKIVPIMIADDDFSLWSKAIAAAVKETGRKVVVICSSDFTHYGFNYGFTPFKTKIKENMEKLDGDAIKLIEKCDAAGFLKYCDKTGATICGKYGIAVLLDLMKGKKGKLLKYYTSADIVGDYSNAVGYGAIVFR
jgi:AmmeMemoRadiSam system protein B